MINEKFIICSVCNGEEGSHDAHGIWTDCSACEGEGGHYIIVSSDCGHQCFIIGGPFIAEDPNCPVHGKS